MELKRNARQAIRPFFLHITLFCLILIIPLSIFTTTPSDAASITTVAIYMDDYANSIDPLIANSTTFRGNIDVKTTGSTPVVVKLQESYPEPNQDDWEAEFQPGTMYFDVSSKRHFDVTIMIPEFTAADDYHVTINGYWQFEGDDEWEKISDSVRIYVLQYYDISIEPSESMLPYLELDESSELYYDIFIINEGNGKDTLTLELLNKNELIERDWEITFSPFQYDMIEFSAMPVRISISPPPINLPLQTDLEFQVSSKSDETFKDKLDIHVISEKQRYIIASGLKPLVILRPLDVTILELKPGKTILFEVEARCFIDDSTFSLNPTLFRQEFKEGAVRFDFDRINNEKETGINIDITPSKMNLEPGQSDIFIIEVTGINDTNEPERYIELLRVDIQARDVLSNSINIEFYYFTFGNKDENRLFVLTTASAVAVTTFSLIAAIGAVVGGTEVGRYHFLLLFIPLYTKLHKEKVLDHFIRGRIYEYIRSHQGSHFSEIKRELKLNNGGLAYHLYTLEREELIRSFRSGKLKLFYTREFGIPKETGRQFTELEAIILQIIDENPGISQREVGEYILNRNHRTVSHNIKQLSRDGYIRLEKDGRSNQCYIDISQLQRSETEPKQADMKKSSMTFRI